MITVIDTGISNIGSVRTALDRIGAVHKVTSDPADVTAAKALMLPGVGAFGDGMAALKRFGLVEPIKEFAAHGRPVIGVCLGMQLLADESLEFGRHEGLGLVPGRVVPLPEGEGVRIPNIGWCDTQLDASCGLFQGLDPVEQFYYVHSFVMHCRDAHDSVANINFAGQTVTVGVQRGSVFGLQFHPEKSQDVGLAALSNFVEMRHAIFARRAPADQE